MLKLKGDGDNILSRVKRERERVEMCIINKITIQSVRQRLIEAHKNVHNARERGLLYVKMCRS